METVAIFGVPRSGTSWLGQIFNSSPQVAYRYQPIFSYSFDKKISNRSTTQEIEEFHDSLLKTRDDFVCQTQNLSGNQAPSFSKGKVTHLVWKEVRYLDIIQNLLEKSSTKVIGIIRHPCGIINSWQNAPREFDNKWDILKEWRNANKKNKNKHDFYGFEKWIEVTKTFLRLEAEFPDQFKIQTYERLAYAPFENIQKLFEFVNLPMDSQTESFLKESTSTLSKDPYDVYRENKTGFEWKKQLNPVIINEIKNDARFIQLEKYFEWNTLDQQKK